MSAAWPWLALMNQRDLAVLGVLADATDRGQVLTWGQVQEALEGSTYSGTQPFLAGAYALAWRSDGAREWLIRPAEGSRPKWRRDLERYPEQRWEVASQEVLAAHRSGTLAGHTVNRNSGRSKTRRFPDQQRKSPRILSGPEWDYVRSGHRKNAA
jgi:hypothetical protein